MSDSRVITTDFEYHSADALDEALVLLKESGATPLAGGTDLLNNMKTGGLTPKALLYILDCAELNFIREDASRKELIIGAAARLRDIEEYPAVVNGYPALREAVNVIGGTQIRNMATLGGNICNASPGADTPPVLIVLGARAELCRAGKDKRECRDLKVEEIFSGPKKTVLAADELLTAVMVPEPAQNSGQSFRRLARVRLDIAKINCAVYIERDGDTIAEIRVCMGSVGPTPLRSPSVESALRGKKPDAGVLEKACSAVLQDIHPIDDVRSTAEYRNAVAPVLVREAVEEAWSRSGGKL